MEPLISVIIPVYNVRAWLDRCIQSVLAQTYRSLQVILIDDGSTDGSGELCDSYLQKDDRIEVIHQKNAGLSAARNTGLDAARGAYIAFVDSDDWIYPEMYSVLYQLLTAQDADIAQGAARSNVSSKSPAQEKLAVFSGKELFEAAIRQKWGWTVWLNLYKADLWQGLRFDEGYYYEDALILPELARRCKKCVQTNRVLYYYTRRSDGILRQRKNARHLASQAFVYRRYLQLAENGEQPRPLVAYYLCTDIASYRKILRPARGLSHAEAAGHKRQMHALYRTCYRPAKQCDLYAQAPGSKKLLWRIYYACPAAANAMLTAYKTLLEFVRKKRT